MVRQEGASLVVAGSYRKRRLVVVGDRVDAGARCPVETEACLRRDWVQVYQVPEVEGSHECAIACIIGAWIPSVRWPSCRVGVGPRKLSNNSTA